MINLPDTLAVECGCVPNSPFYVRWLNRFGGIDYWMFEKRQTYERKQDDFEDYEPYIADYSTAHGTTYAATKEASEHVTVGAEPLTPNEWEELSRIPFSPFVQWFKEDRTPRPDGSITDADGFLYGAWVDILTEKGECELITDKPAQTLELTFLLPKPQLQF